MEPYQSYQDDDTQQLAEETPHAQTRTVHTVDTGIQLPIGRRKTFKSLETPEKVLLILSIVLLLCSIPLTILTAYKAFNDHVNYDNADFSLSLLLLVNIGFAVKFLIFGIFFQRPFELLGYTIGSCAVCTYVIVNYAIRCHFHVEECTNYVKLPRLIVSVLFYPAILCLSVHYTKVYFIRRELVYRATGSGDEQTLKRGLRYLCLISSLWLDLDFHCSMLMLVLRWQTGESFHDVTTAEAIILGGGVVLSVAFMLIGYAALRWENVRLLKMYCCTMIFTLSYIIYRLILVFLDAQQCAVPTAEGVRSLEQRRCLLSLSALIACSLCFVWKCCTILQFINVRKWFNTGLNTRIFGFEED